MPTFAEVMRTPIPDFIWGPRPSKIRDYRKLIAASELPAPIQTGLLTTIRKARLWRSENLALARELLAHFHDAIASGESAEIALASFGDPLTAAQLIRRSRLRNRPLWWKLFRAAKLTFAAIVALYLASGLYFFAGKPRVTVDYLALINASILATPESDRAWPLYRQALIPGRAERQREEEASRLRFRDLLDEPTTGDRFPALEALVGRRQAFIVAIRAATRKPVLGFVAGARGSDDDRELWPELAGKPRDPTIGGTMLEGIMPNLSEMRGMAEHLSADARVARVRKDSGRWMADIIALRDMSRQLTAKPHTLVSSLVGNAVMGVALDEIDWMLTDAPSLLSENQLRDLAHALAGPRVAADLVDLSYEQYFYYDTVQRTYTQNGHDDGRFTPEGYQYGRLAGVISGNARKDIRERAAPLLLSGFAPVVLASRREATRVYDELMDEVEANLAKPMRETNWPATTAHIKAAVSAGEGLQFPLLRQLVPTADRLQVQLEHTLALRDAKQVAIALEIHHRRMGSYPVTLAELVPSLLPSPPKDPITGGPLGYLVQDGKPLLYSFGLDRKDDHGVLPIAKRIGAYGRRTPTRAYSYWLAAEWFPRTDDYFYPKPEAIPQGDWRLFPGDRPPPPEPDDE